MLKKVVVLLMAAAMFQIGVGADNVITGDGNVQVNGDGNIVGSDVLDVNIAGNNFYFYDVEGYSWAEDAINYFAELGIVEGTGDGMFEPESSVTREQFAKMLVLAFSADLNNPQENTFSDVTKDNWSYPYVETSRDFLTGYVNPFGGKPSFHPAAACTREDVAVALVRICGYDVKNIDTSKPIFSDLGDVSPGLQDYVYAAAKIGLIKGYEDATFRPGNPVTRAESVVLLNRATKQAMAAVGEELELYADISHQRTDEGLEVTIEIEAEDGTKVNVNGESVRMYSTFGGYLTGTYTYKMAEEGIRAFVVGGENSYRSGVVTLTATYYLEAPIITIISCPESSSGDSITIAGQVDDYDCILTVNGQTVYKSGNSWTYNTKLDTNKGVNKFTITATNKDGKSTTIERSVKIDSYDPIITLDDIPDETDEPYITLSGRVSDTGGGVPELTLNGLMLSTDSYGYWSVRENLMRGKNLFRFIAKNTAGRTTKVDRTVYYSSGVSEDVSDESEKEPGQILLEIHNVPKTTSESVITVSGTINSHDTDVTVTVNGAEAAADYSDQEDGTRMWTAVIELTEGANVIKVAANGKHSETVPLTRTVKYTAPETESGDDGADQPLTDDEVGVD